MAKPKVGTRDELKVVTVRLSDRDLDRLGKIARRRRMVAGPERKPQTRQLIRELLREAMEDEGV